MTWTHNEGGDCKIPDCDGDVSCAGFPTIRDRAALADAYHNDYIEAGEEAESTRKGLADLLQDFVINCMDYDYSQEDIVGAVESAMKEWADNSKALAARQTA